MSLDLSSQLSYESDMPQKNETDEYWDTDSERSEEEEVKYDSISVAEAGLQNVEEYRKVVRILFISEEWKTGDRFRKKMLQREVWRDRQYVKHLRGDNWRDLETNTDPRMAFRVIANQVPKEISDGDLMRMIQEYELFVFCFDADGKESFEIIKQRIQMVERVKGFSALRGCVAALIGDSSYASWSLDGKDKFKYHDPCVKDFAGYYTRRGFEMSGQWCSSNSYSSGMLSILQTLCTRKVVKDDELSSKDGLLDFCLSNYTEIAYDCVAILISLADMITDLWVLYQWHTQGRTLPFWISIAIISAAQISYVIAFVHRFTDDTWSMTDIWFRVVPYILPIAPTLPLLFYFAHTPTSKVGRFMIERDYIIDSLPSRGDQSKISSFIREKVAKHVGFILEAGVEALPQSILQMAVMVWYGETSYLSIISISLSLISVCSKSLVLSYALEMKTFLFNYLSLVHDFVGIFVLTSWLFYSPDQGGGSLTLSARIYVWKVLLSTIPIAGFGLAFAIASKDTLFLAHTVDRMWEATKRKPCVLTCTRCCIGSVSVLTWLVAFPVAVLILEIGCCSVLALSMFVLFGQRFNANGPTIILWGKAIAFVNNSESWSDTLLRVCLINEEMHKTLREPDNELNEYLSDHRQSMYTAVTWNALREHCRYSDKAKNPLMGPQELIEDVNDNSVQSMKDYWRWNIYQVYKSKIRGNKYASYECVQGCCRAPCSFGALYLALPIYIVTRMLNFLFVWFVVVQTDYRDMQGLQIAMAVILFVLQSLWLFMLYSVLRLNFISWHLMPGQLQKKQVVATEAEALNFLRKVRRLHEALTLEPLRRKAIEDVFGDDVTSVVCLYLPTLLHELGERKNEWATQKVQSFED